MSQPSPAVCRYFAANGTCFYGDSCNYAHIRVSPSDQPPRLQQQPPPQMQILQPSDRAPSPAFGPGSGADLSGPRPRSQIMCRNILQSGYCRYLPHCPYNHDLKGSDDGQNKNGDLAGPMQKMSLGGPPGGMGFQKPFGPPGGPPGPNPGFNYGMFGGPGPLQGPPGMPGGPFMPPYDTPPQILTRPIDASGERRFGDAPAGPAGGGGRGQGRPRQAEGVAGGDVSAGASAFVPSVQPVGVSELPGPSPSPGPGPVTTHTTRGGTVYFYGDSNQSAPLIQYNTAKAPPMHRPPPQSPASPIKPAQAAGRRTAGSFFMPEDLRAELQRKNHIIWDVLNPDEGRAKDLSHMVNRYHSLQPLDVPGRQPTNAAFGYYTALYKCISTADGSPVALRRIENFRVSNELALRFGEMWRNVRHPNIATLVDIFISAEIGDVNALYFAYEFHPGAETLEQRWFAPNSEPIPEPIVWSYITQLVSAIRSVHRLGMAVRTLLPSKIIVTPQNRLRVSSPGIVDVVAFETTKNVQQNQHEDLLNLGKLLLSLTCKSMSAVQNPQKSMELVATRFSADLKNVIMYLLGRPPVAALPNLDELTVMIAPRLLFEAEQLHTKADDLEKELLKEVENGRMFRMLVKLGFINERPEFEMDPSWSETGDRYLLKLFRDYVFHQVYEDGSPVVDFAHVVDCLNKLDVGSAEKILLMSRDEQSILVVSYKDLKRAIESAFNDLASKKSGGLARKRIL